MSTEWEGLQHYRNYNTYKPNNKRSTHLGIPATRKYFKKVTNLMALFSSLRWLVNKLQTLAVLMALFSQKNTKFHRWRTNCRPLAVLMALKLSSLKLQTLAVLMALFSKAGHLVNKLLTLAVLMALFSKVKKCP